jgi:hypothetical protein
MTTQKEYVGPATGTGLPLYAYGGVAGRLWLGDPYKSAWVSASGLAYQPIHQSQQAEAEIEAKQDITTRIGQLYQEQCGLIPSQGTLERIEWLVIWDADGTMTRRIQYFEEARRATIVSDPRSLTQTQVRDIVRQWNGTREVLPETGKLILPPGVGR